MTNGKSATGRRVNEALVQTIGHPLGYSILRILAERDTASGKEIAAVLAKPRSTVGEQLRKLQADGLVECVTEKERRGTVERSYRVTPASRWVDDAETGEIGIREKKKMALRIVQSAVADAAAALSTNTLDHRDNWCLGATRLTVDARGWNELAEIHRRVLEEVERVRTDSAARLAEGTTEDSITAGSSVMLLELPKE